MVLDERVKKSILVNLFYTIIDFFERVKKSMIV